MGFSHGVTVLFTISYVEIEVISSAPYEKSATNFLLEICYKLLTLISFYRNITTSKARKAAMGAGLGAS